MINHLVHPPPPLPYTTLFRSEPLLHANELLDLALEQPGHGDPGPLGDGGGDVLLVHLLAQHAALRVLVVEPRLEFPELLLEGEERAVAELGRTVQVTAALGVDHRVPRGLDPLLDLADPGSLPSPPASAP